MFIGNLRKNTPTYSEIEWTKNHVKTLGINHGYNIDLADIFNRHTGTIKNTLNTWKKRNLTLHGKVLVIKIFGISKLLFETEIIGIPEIYIKEIEKIMNDFLWDGKQPLLNIETCYL